MENEKINISAPIKERAKFTASRLPKNAYLQYSSAGIMGGDSNNAYPPRGGIRVDVGGENRGGGPKVVWNETYSMSVLLTCRSDGK